MLQLPSRISRFDGTFLCRFWVVVAFTKDHSFRIVIGDTPIYVQLLRDRRDYLTPPVHLSPLGRPAPVRLTTVFRSEDPWTVAARMAGAESNEGVAIEYNAQVDSLSIDVYRICCVLSRRRTTIAFSPLLPFRRLPSLQDSELGVALINIPAFPCFSFSRSLLVATKKRERARDVI